MNEKCKYFSNKRAALVWESSQINIPYTVDTIMKYAFLNNSPEIIYCNSSSYGMKWAK